MRPTSPRDDQSGCVQTSAPQCSSRLSHWDRWSQAVPGPSDRLSGPVCGQDPRTCVAPASVAPNVWPDDITHWPLCHAANGSGENYYTRSENYNCEVIGRPCCVGIHGECHITTREHCSFLHGSFHDTAALCSQVQCLLSVCRMLPFLDPDTPDQVYRLWTSLFLHAGVIPYLLTVFLHLVYMRSLEKFAGTTRVCIIYIGAGVTGNLASAVFVPYRAEVGPSGALAGVVACLFVVFLVDHGDSLRSNARVLVEWLVFLLVVFTFGLFPGVDNYANMFGFIMGCFLSAMLLPHVGHIRKPQLDGIRKGKGFVVATHVVDCAGNADSVICTQIEGNNAVNSAGAAVDSAVDAQAHNSAPHNPAFDNTVDGDQPQPPPPYQAQPSARGYSQVDHHQPRLSHPQPQNTPPSYQPYQPQPQQLTSAYHPQPQAVYHTQPSHHVSSKRRLLTCLFSLLLSALLLTSLLLAMYVLPPIESTWLGYLDCVPFTESLCAEQESSFHRHNIVT